MRLIWKYSVWTWVLLLVFLAFLILKCFKDGIAFLEPLILLLACVAAVVFLLIGLWVWLAHESGRPKFDEDMRFRGRVFVVTALAVLTVIWLWLFVFNVPLGRRRVPS
jgi:hypothetical protein